MDTYTFPELTRPDLIALRKGGKVLAFRDLPEAAQLALVQYMAINGEAWELAPELEPDYKPRWRKDREPWASYLRRTLPFYAERYGDYRIGYIPCIHVEELKAAVMASHQLPQEFTTWKEYHAWYTSSITMPTYRVIRKSMWPVILSSYNDEALQDGWRRFHQYIRRGVKSIPGLFYVDNKTDN